MSGLVDIVFNIELSLEIAIVTSLVLGSLLLLINVPDTEYSRKLLKTKNTIAVCFFICTIIFYQCLKHSGIPEYETFSALMMFVVTAISSAILSFSLINLLQQSDADKFYLNVGLVAAFSWLMIKSFWWNEGPWRTFVMAICIVLFIIQCVSHILVFNKAYRKTVEQFETYYDEEEDKKIRWIRFCYIIMMLTQMFILVYMLLPHGFMKVYTIWYSVFMLYFTANFISYLGSHRLLLDAFAHRTLSGRDLVELIESRKKGKKVSEVPLSAPAVNETEYRKLEKALDKWVDEKRYREYDKSREQIARELNTSKEILHHYFITRKGIDFKTWRTMLRIEEAKRLLLEDKDASINIIAEVAGFSDRSNFHRQFVKIVGCSPKQWRDSDGKPAQQ